jgi:glycerol uptake facilitator protein
MRDQDKPINWLIGETLGTFLLVFFGCGSVATAVALNAPVGLFQVAIVWGFGLIIAIFLSGSLSGAHLNPAITISLVVFRSFPIRKALGYIIAQFAGAFLAASIVFLVYGGAIEAFEANSGIIRGEPGSEASAMIFGEFYPNPGGKALPEPDQRVVTGAQGFLSELLGTALLAIVVFTLTDKRSNILPTWVIPFAIGITLTVLISLFAPVSMGGFNPARDLAPRIFSSMAGWGDLPFSANGYGWLTVYVLGPILGALLGGLGHRALIRR